jgi:predicted dehydrogenase
MSDRALSLGFVGGAPNSAAGYAHFAAVRLDNLWSLDAGAFSTHEDINQQAAVVYGVDKARTYAALDDLLAAEARQLDAVALLTPTPLHYEMTLRCLRAGVPVICEKALALTSAQAQEIHAVCEDLGGFLAVVYNYSGYPMVRELRRLIQDGVLGEILHFQAEMPQEGYLRTPASGNPPTVQSWRLEDGPVPMLHLDLAVHLHELLHYLTGLQPLEVVADQSSRGWFDVVDYVSCLARYSRNVQGQLWFSKCALGHRNGLRLRIYGSEASAEWYQMNPEELVLSRRDGSRELRDRASGAAIAADGRYQRFKAGHPAGFIEALGNLYVDMHAALTQYFGDGQYHSDEIFGAGLAAEGLAFLEAIVASCQSHAWESVRYQD